MKNKIFPLLTAVCAALALAGCGKVDLDHDNDKAAAGSTNAPEASEGVQMDQETQERVGLKIATPTAAQWQPKQHLTGWMADVPALMADAADYEAAQAQAQASQSDLDRNEKLAAENNASARALETARAQAAHDVMALKSLRAKFAAMWGMKLAADTNLMDTLSGLVTNGTTLVKILLPAGTAAPSPVGKATVQLLEDGAGMVPATFSDDLGIDPATQQDTLLFITDRPLPARAAVTAELETGGEALNGVEVPAEAVLRHEGKGWVYEQTGTNAFERVEVPLDRQTAGGWFMTEALTTTNKIVVEGAQTVLSAELTKNAPAAADND